MPRFHFRATSLHLYALVGDGSGQMLRLPALPSTSSRHVSFFALSQASPPLSALHFLFPLHGGSFNFLPFGLLSHCLLVLPQPGYALHPVNVFFLLTALNTI